MSQPLDPVHRLFCFFGSDVAGGLLGVCCSEYGVKHLCLTDIVCAEFYMNFMLHSLLYVFAILSQGKASH